TKVAVIGTATDIELCGHGIGSDFMPRKFTSKGLVEELNEQNEIAGKKFLLLRSDIAPDWLPNAIREAGAARVDDVSCYRVLPITPNTNEVARAVEQGIDYIPLTSGSVVRQF